MNETTHPPGVADVPWPSRDQRTRVPDTSMLPGTEQARPAALNSLNQVVDRAHDALDRLADSAAPTVRQLGEGVTAAETALRETAGQIGETRDRWVEGLRSTVRGRPLTALAVAMALGAAIARAVR